MQNISKYINIHMVLNRKDVFLPFKSRPAVLVEPDEVEDVENTSPVESPGWLNAWVAQRRAHKVERAPLNPTRGHRVEKGRWVRLRHLRGFWPTP